MLEVNLMLKNHSHLPCTPQDLIYQSVLFFFHRASVFLSGKWAQPLTEGKTFCCSKPLNLGVIFVQQQMIKTTIYSLFYERFKSILNIIQYIIKSVLDREVTDTNQLFGLSDFIIPWEDQIQLEVAGHHQLIKLHEQNGTCKNQEFSQTMTNHIHQIQQ